MTTPYQFTNAQLFTPSQISGCQLWLDAADASTITFSGTSVTAWRDKSGLGNNATATGTITNLGRINTKPGMNYPGTSSTYFSGSISNTGPTLSVFSVFIMNASSYIVARILSLAAPATADFNNTLYTSAIQRDSTNFLSYRAGANRGTIAATFGVPSLFGSIFNGSSNTVYLNGTTGNTAATSGNFGYTRYVVGSSSGEENLVPLNGVIGEVLSYTTALSTDQRQQIEGYLAWKWGLQAQLPASHPYKQTPPYRTQPFPLVPAIQRQTNQLVFPLPNTVNRYINKNWIPLNVANCQVWLDAADQATIQYSTGSNVSVWRDKSGNNNTASTSTNYPTYSQSSLNRLGTLRFSGASGTPNYLDMGPFQFGTNTRSFFLVIQNTAGATGIATIPHIFFPGSPYPAVSMSIAGWFAINIQGTSTQAEYFADRNRYYIFSYTLGPPSGIAADPEKLYANGSLVHSGTTGPYANATNGYRIGWLTNGDNTNNYYFDGNIAEFLIFNTFVTDFQRQQVEGYLAWKWGLQTQLPGNHPYKLFPPSP
jgi:hypothetical protein